MKDQKGITLIEVLAALTLGVIAIGLLTQAYFAIHLEWNNSTSKYNEDTKARLVLDTMTYYLSDSIEATPFTNGLKFKTAKGEEKAFIWENGKLGLYNVTSSGYEPIMDSLADNVPASPIYTVSSSPSKLVTTKISFTTIKYDIHGASSENTKPYEIHVKLLDDKIN